MKNIREFGVSTKGLIKSFGSGSGEEFEQHDMQEFCQKLLDAIEKKLQNTEYDSILSQIFEGEMISFLRGRNPQKNKTEQVSPKVEKFQDIQLNVPQSDIIFNNNRREYYSRNDNGRGEVVVPNVSLFLFVWCFVSLFILFFRILWWVGFFCTMSLLLLLFFFFECL